MFISQPIRWGPQPINSYYITGTFWEGRKVIKWGFHNLLMELEKEKRCFQSWRAELSESSEKMQRAGAFRRPGLQAPWTLSEDLCLKAKEHGWAEDREGFTSLERFSDFLSQTVPEDWVPTTCWDTKSFEFDQTTVYIAKDLHIINSTPKYVFNWLLSPK